MGKVWDHMNHEYGPVEINIIIYLVVLLHASKYLLINILRCGSIISIPKFCLYLQVVSL